MMVVRSLAEIKKDNNSVVTVGTFDGVHLAHQEIIREVVNRARMLEGRSVVVTFDPHPKEIVGNSQHPVRLLTTLQERIALIAGLNVDLLLVINFTYEFSRISAREFYATYIVNGIGVGEVVVGYDHMFGRDRTGGIEELVRIGQEFNFSVSAVHPYRVNNVVVSSSKVREAILAGAVERAAELSGRLYVLSGTVVHGDGRGATLGYPTANIEPDSTRKVIPGRGVYLVGVSVQGNQMYGMMNIGVRPTVRSGEETSIEVHIFGLERDIYGEKVSVSFVRKLRDEQKFSSLEELTHQLRKDREVSLQLLSEFEKRK